MGRAWKWHTRDTDRGYCVGNAGRGRDRGGAVGMVTLAMITAHLKHLSQKQREQRPTTQCAQAKFAAERQEVCGQVACNQERGSFKRLAAKRCGACVRLQLCRHASHGYMDGWTNEWMDTWMDKWMDGQMNAWIHGWTNGWMDKWMDKWMDGQMYG
eukprot:364617-Chlamydomonas_euryale.AAC.4